jgi:hypothetical protein
MTQTNFGRDAQKRSFALDLNPESAESEILKAIRTIRYGSVEVIIHDSRIVQIECKNKIRVRDGDLSGDRGAVSKG